MPVTNTPAAARNLKPLEGAKESNASNSSMKTTNAIPARPVQDKIFWRLARTRYTLDLAISGTGASGWM